MSTLLSVNYVKLQIQQQVRRRSRLISEAIAYNRLPLACLIVQRRAVTVRIEMGMDGAGKPVLIDIEELLATRLLVRSEEHTSELQSLMRISYAVFCLKKKIPTYQSISTQ